MIDEVDADHGRGASAGKAAAAGLSEARCLEQKVAQLAEVRGRLVRRRPDCDRATAPMLSISRTGTSGAHRLRHAFCTFLI